MSSRNASEVEKLYSSLTSSFLPDFPPHRIKGMYEAFKTKLEKIRKEKEKITQEVLFIEEALGVHKDIPDMPEDALQDSEIDELEIKYEKLVAELEQKQELLKDQVEKYPGFNGELNYEIGELEKKINEITLQRRARLRNIHERGGDEEYIKRKDIAWIKHSREEENFKRRITNPTLYTPAETASNEEPAKHFETEGEGELRRRNELNFPVRETKREEKNSNITSEIRKRIEILKRKAENKQENKLRKAA